MPKPTLTVVRVLDRTEECLRHTDGACICCDKVRRVTGSCRGQRDDDGDDAQVLRTALSEAADAMDCVISGGSFHRHLPPAAGKIRHLLNELGE